MHVTTGGYRNLASMPYENSGNNYGRIGVSYDSSRDARSGANNRAVNNTPVTQLVYFITNINVVCFMMLQSGLNVVNINVLLAQTPKKSKKQNHTINFDNN